MDNGIEMIWQEEVVAKFRLHPSISVEGEKKTTKNINQDSRYMRQF
jgi:hypothetical protein